MYFDVQQDDRTFTPMRQTVDMNTLDRWDKMYPGFWTCVKEYYDENPHKMRETMVPRISERLKALAEQTEPRRSRQRAESISSGGSVDEDYDEEDDSDYEDSSSDDHEQEPVYAQDDASSTDPMPHDGSGGPDGGSGPTDDQEVASSSACMPPTDHVNRFVLHPRAAFPFGVPPAAGDFQWSEARPQWSCRKTAPGSARPGSHPNTSQAAAAPQGHLHREAFQGLPEELESTQEVSMSDIPAQAPSQPEPVSTPGPVQEHAFPASAPEQSGKGSVPAAESGQVLGKTSSPSSMFPSRSQ